MAISYKRRIRMIRAVRLEAGLYKDNVIAALLNMTPAGLAVLKQDPEYSEVRLQVLTGVVSDAEKTLLEDTRYKHEQLRELIPQAFQNLYDLARSQNEHIKLKASTEILDREGTMSKVSRIGLAMPDQGGAGTTIDDEVATNLLRISHLQAERAKKDAENAGTEPSKGSTTIQ